MKYSKKVICLLLAFVIILPLTACSESGQGKAVMTFRGQELSTNMLSYMLTSHEAYYLAYNNIYLPYVYQNSADYQSIGSFETFNYYAQYYAALREVLEKSFIDSFSTQITDVDGKVTTLGAVYFDALMTYMKRSFVINTLCNEYGLELTDTAVLGDISSEIQGYIDSAGNADFLDIYLYEKHGASLDIAREYAEKYSLTYMLTSELGGAWDSEYKYLNYLLYDYLYGENGMRRISDEDVKSKFFTDYCMFDYVNYSVYRTDGTNTVLRLDEFIEDDIKELFEANYNKVSYILLSLEDTEGGDVTDTAVSTANEIYSKLVSGELEWGTVTGSYTGTTAGTYCFAQGDSKIDDTVESAAEILNEGDYIVVTGIDSVYILRGETLADTDLPGVKSEITTILSKRYFNDNYNKINYIFLSYNDGNGVAYSDEKKTVIRTLGEEIYGKLQSGECTLDKDDDSSGTTYVEDAYKNAAYTVSVNNVCYAQGELDDNLESKVLTLNIGAITTFEDDYGYYILNRIAKEDSDFADSAVQLTMTMKYMRAIADDFEAKYKNGEIEFEDAEDHDDYVKYNDSNYMNYELYKDQLKEYYSIEKLGDTNISADDTSIYIVHVREIREDDYTTFADKISDEMNYTDFYNYIEGLFDDIVVNEDELALY
ncbi:MAG: hypothetical protein EOM87_07350, partial [Clostridia bacterium]|nr:hypothetical protein [Clostridia bacterium]